MPSEIELARHACLPCRRSKRRCDRKIPSCDLCIKKDIDCNYPGTRTSERDSRTVYSQTPDSQSSQETTQSSNTEASAIYFLAPHIFRQAQLELPRPDIPIPAEVSSLIGDTSSIREIANTFFSTIHFWLPIVFKKGFFVSLLSPWTQRQTELSLLALCMKLCNTAPSEDESPNNFLYRTAKRFHHDVETAGVLSTHVLQAGLLIAYYEMGHAMYPASYLTVGACARYGLALGIYKHCSPTSAAEDEEMRGQRSWNEVEENRRVWWAVLIFDRFLNLNDPTRPLSTEDPTFDMYLPVDDTSWNDCTAKPGDAVRISTGFSLKIGGFARLAQATYLLSQAFHSVTPSAAIKDDTNDLDQAAQLRRTLLALVHAADSEAAHRRLDFCASSEMSFSAILLLQQHHFQRLNTIAMLDVGPQISLDNFWPESFEGVNRLITAATSHMNLTTTDPNKADCVPIFFTHVLYQVGCILLMLGRGTLLDDEIGEKFAVVKRLLLRMNARWRLAGIYADVLQAREIELASETHKTTRQFVCLT
ncbi:hypothetical protein TCE0_033f09660 [Talaromyces pinophilus]|uniref:Zn(2)-C6 fungal-type domain-containing protein n=1 Tax=Talaromyces pinophilus TaxID=128442 RepID=A0A6V8HB89_TALPI|nr:hypothetical protein TCE0_033f09660 [Talaromyces pinophilus]